MSKVKKTISNNYVSLHVKMQQRSCNLLPSLCRTSHSSDCPTRHPFMPPSVATYCAASWISALWQNKVTMHSTRYRYRYRYRYLQRQIYYVLYSCRYI